MSEPGRGTTLTLVLPRAARRPAAQAPTQQAVSPRPKRALSILLVEDNAQVSEMAAALLSEEGHTVEGAATAPGALTKLRDGASYDLIFSDLVMPGGMDGLELALTVRKRWPDLPVLLATGYSAEASRAQQEGFRLLSKPYEPAALADAVAEMAEHRRGAKVISLRPV